MVRACWLPVLLSASLLHAAEPAQPVVDSFELVWTTLRDHYWDAGMAGLDWHALHDRYLQQLKAAPDLPTARAAINALIHSLPSSHLALIPGEVYTGAARPNNSHPTPTALHAGSAVTGLGLCVIDGRVVVDTSEEPAVHTGWTVDSADGQSMDHLLLGLSNEDAQVQTAVVGSYLNGPPGTSVRLVFVKGDGSRATLDLPRRTPPGKLVEFGNLPPERVIAGHKRLPNAVGYIRLNIFLDPVSVMPEMERAISDLRSAPGIILDLRGNPGGLGVMAMGLAGWFTSDEGRKLGTMTARGFKTEFEINPRPEPYTGKLAILVNAASASTSEILAQGLKDLGRARIFGTRTAGAALPSVLIQLPDGDRFQYPEANYTSVKGRVLEGNGVEPDVAAAPTIAALLQGHDLALESAMAWCAAK